MYYTLKHRKVTPIGRDIFNAIGILEDCHKRRIRADHISGFFISTVFLSLDHNHAGMGVPVLFETMIFTDEGHKLDRYQTRCSTHREALSMHHIAKRLVYDFIRENRNA